MPVWQSFAKCGSTAPTPLQCSSGTGNATHTGRGRRRGRKKNESVVRVGGGRREKKVFADAQARGRRKGTGQEGREGETSGSERREDLTTFPPSSPSLPLLSQLLSRFLLICALFLPSFLLLPRLTDRLRPRPSLTDRLSVWLGSPGGGRSTPGHGRGSSLFTEVGDSPATSFRGGFPEVDGTLFFPWSLQAVSPHRRRRRRRRRRR